MRRSCAENVTQLSRARGWLKRFTGVQGKVSPAKDASATAEQANKI